jgi:hypothetical protein
MACRVFRASTQPVAAGQAMEIMVELMLGRGEGVHYQKAPSTA